MKRVIVTIDKTGSGVKIEADGFVGTGCKGATKSIEAVLKSGEVEVEEKPEMRMVERAQASNRQTI